MKRKHAKKSQPPDSFRLCAQSLPPCLVHAWRKELWEAHSQDARAHWWTESHWVPLSGLGPDTLLGATVDHLCDHLVPEQVGLCGVEFWIQRRNPDAGMQAHWDCDEDLGRTSGQLAFPLVSTVIYLGSVGGPTLVMDVVPECLPVSAGTVEGCTAWFAWPQTGQAIAFRGDLLHAVVGLARGCGESAAALPSMLMSDDAKRVASGAGSEDVTSSPAPSAFRETLILNFWREQPPSLDEIPQSLIPLMRPRSTNGVCQADCVYMGNGAAPGAGSGIVGSGAGLWSGSGEGSGASNSGEWSVGNGGCGSTSGPTLCTPPCASPQGAAARPPSQSLRGATQRLIPLKTSAVEGPVEQPTTAIRAQSLSPGLSSVLIVSTSPLVELSAAPSESGSWGCTTTERRKCSMLLGMFDRTRLLTLHTPPVKYRGQPIESWITSVYIGPLPSSRS